MYRFPNPGSDLNILISIYKIIYKCFGEKYFFNIDNISEVLVNSGAITSSGSVGKEALRRSFNKKRSLDPVYNQVKMYSEIFRKLGFISSYNSQLNYINTNLGKMIVSSDKNNQKKIIRNSLLGVVSPNETIIDKNKVIIRPFKNILLAAHQLQNKISKAEVIFILSYESDQEKNYHSDIVKKIIEMRSGKENEYLQQIKIRRKITFVTMGNYTRFPLGAMLWSEWFQKKDKYFHLTKIGEGYADKIQKSKDLRINDLKYYTNTQLIKFSNNFLFNGNYEYIFSHYQQLNIEKFKIKKRKEYSTKNKYNQIDKEKSKINFIELFNTPKKIERNSNIKISISEIANYKQKDFYPLTVNLLKKIGFDARVSRIGVNNNRTDALINYNGNYIPVEIKSPTEEMMISPKAVRQAIENKIIFLSRKIFPTTIEFSTFVVGFDIPNERSEIHELITSSFKYFDIRINLISIKTLINLSNSVSNKGLTIDKEKFLKSYGISKTHKND